MEEISIRKYQQESGERPFQFTKIEGSNSSVPLHPPSFFPNSSQKNVMFSCPKIIPSASTACSGGAPGWSPGLWCCPRWTSLYSGSQSPSTHWTVIKRRTREKGPLPPVSTAPRGHEKEQPWVSYWCGCGLLNLSILHSIHENKSEVILKNFIYF